MFDLILSGDELVKELIRRQPSAPRELRGLVLEFERAFYRLPAFADALCDRYREITSLGWPDPGVVALSLGGGRAHGNRWVSSTDIDIYFWVERIEGSIDPYAWGPSVLQDFSLERRERKRRLIEVLGESIDEFGIGVPVDLRSYGSWLSTRLFSNYSHVVLGRS